MKKKFEIFVVPLYYLGILKRQDIYFNTILPRNHYSTVRITYLFLVSTLILGAKKMLITL